MAQKTRCVHPRREVERSHQDVSHLDHDNCDVPEDRGRRSQILALLTEGKRSFPSFLAQELYTTAEEGTPLDQFLLHSNTKDLPQTGQIAVDRRGTALQRESRLFKVPDHLRRDLIEIFPAKDGLQVADATQIRAMRVGTTFYLDGVKKTVCKIPEQGNLLLRENSRAPLGQSAFLMHPTRCATVLFLR